jgi:hypothetical protein
MYTFSGFFQPVDNPPTLNIVNAGRGIPFKFSLNGDQGMDILAAGYPASQTVACSTSLPTDVVEQTVTAGTSELTYDTAMGMYTYVWKTNKAWAGTCRQFILKLDDGSEHTAVFKFVRSKIQK